MACHLTQPFSDVSHLARTVVLTVPSPWLSSTAQQAPRFPRAWQGEARAHTCLCGPEQIAPIRSAAHLARERVLGCRRAPEGERATRQSALRRVRPGPIARPSLASPDRPRRPRARQSHALRKALERGSACSTAYPRLCSFTAQSCLRTWSAMRETFALQIAQVGFALHSHARPPLRIFAPQSGVRTPAIEPAHGACVFGRLTPKKARPLRGRA